jgi:hypothetical protein
LRFLGEEGINWQRPDDEDRPGHNDEIRTPSVKSENTMESSSDVIVEAAMKLPESERLAVVSRLLETLPPGDVCMLVDDPLLRDELDRRFDDRDGSVSWSELRAEKRCQRCESMDVAVAHASRRQGYFRRRD